jgi:hypothetical protein
MSAVVLAGGGGFGKVVSRKPGVLAVFLHSRKDGEFVVVDAGVLAS